MAEIASTRCIRAPPAHAEHAAHPRRARRREQLTGVADLAGPSGTGAVQHDNWLAPPRAIVLLRSESKIPSIRLQRNGRATSARSGQVSTHRLASPADEALDLRFEELPLGRDALIPMAASKAAGQSRTLVLQVVDEIEGTPNEPAAGRPGAGDRLETAAASTVEQVLDPGALMSAFADPWSRTVQRLPRGQS